MQGQGQGRQRITFEIIENVRVVRFLDKVISQVFGEADDVEALGQKLDVVVDEIGAANLLLDFSEVEYMASYMVAKLYLVDKKLREHGGRLKICGLQPLLTEIMRIAGIGKFLAIYPDYHSAMDAFAKS